ncbi:MAG: flagellar export chaperone FliS [Acidobacteriia bacterium]|nr:flagellar export chaperone FliS [Terriglobia bacterium]
MSMRAQEAYRTEKILSADPMELVRLLYKGAMGAVEAARLSLAAADIRGRSAAISKAFEILGELTVSLDHDRAPEVSRRLAELYDYMQRRLLAANFEQADAPLAEVLSLLETLAEVWNQVPAPKPSTTATAPIARAWNPPATEPAPAAQGWSF